MTDDERSRVERVYAAYDTSAAHGRKWNSERPGNAYLHAERLALQRRVLQEEGLLPLAGKRILDVGCGSGDELARLCADGASPTLCFGIDLLSSRVEAARAAHPEMQFACGDARSLPFADGTFDLVSAHVVFSSILDRGVAAAVAAEMRRVLAPGGAILWRDQRLPNPLNRNVRAYRAADLARLFPGSRIRLDAHAPLPPLTRAVGAVAPPLLPLLARLPFLHAHYLAVIRAP